MADSAGDRPTGASSATQTPSHGTPTAFNTPLATISSPLAIPHTSPSPTQLMLPLPSPNPTSLAPLLPSILAHTAPVCSTAKASLSEVSSCTLAHTSSAAIPEAAPPPKSLKFQSQICALQAQIANTQASLDKTLAKFRDQLSATTAELPPGSTSDSLQSELDSLAQAEAIVRRHIKLLHDYNEIKDVGQGLMGLIADARGVRLTEVMEEMGAGEKD